MAEGGSPGDQVRRMFGAAEERTSEAMDQLVARDSFGEVLARTAGISVALIRMSTDVADGVVGQLRLAGRRDIVKLARQLARTEDKLETVLQEVERLSDRVAALQVPEPSSGSNSRSARSSSSRSSAQRSRTASGNGRRRSGSGSRASGSGGSASSGSGSRASGSGGSASSGSGSRASGSGSSSS